MSRINNYSYEPFGVYATADSAIAAADEWTKQLDVFCHVVDVKLEQPCTPGFTIYDNSLTVKLQT